MYQTNETELTNRINTFMARKTKQLAEREELYSQSAADSSTTSRTPSLLEKMNEFWVSRVHA